MGGGAERLIHGDGKYTPSSKPLTIVSAPLMEYCDNWYRYMDQDTLLSKCLYSARLCSTLDSSPIDATYLNAVRFGQET